ncbi:MAG: hypothetical protein GYA36_18340 [Veillonellaceae bacterium]|nr:hypothetical protein [Veillonellaceae bacterium]
MAEELKMKEAIAGLMKEKGQREALAQLIVEYVNPNHITTDFIGLIMNTRNLSPNDALVKKVRKGASVRTWVPGSISLKEEITVTDRINYVLDAGIVSLLANEWELESGEIGTVESIRNEARLALKDYYMNKVFTALSTVWTASNTPNNYTDCGGDITATALKNMINRINQTTSGAKAIVGVRSALTPITEFGAFWSDGTNTAEVPSQIEEVMRTGWLGRYMGVPLIALNQIYDNPQDHTALLPEDKVLVIGEGVGEFITYGPERMKEWTDNEPTPPYWHLDLVQMFGMIIDNAEGIGVLKVS